MSPPIPIIFTHMGDSRYLDITMRMARYTGNQSLILIGDSVNKKYAKKNGWDFIDHSQLESRKLREFHSVFIPVSGRLHSNQRGALNWLRYVFERWFLVEELCKSLNFKQFFHFDSDTLILVNLTNHYESFQLLDGTTQCNDFCLNGWVTTSLLNDYTEFMISIFRDTEYLNSQRSEFEKINPTFAFTEMRAFDEFMRRAKKRYEVRHLANLIRGFWFDDALMQEHGFRMKRTLGGHRIKELQGALSSGIYGFHERDGLVKFLSLNMSWLPLHYYIYVEKMFIATQKGVELKPWNRASVIFQDFLDKALHPLRVLKNMLFRRFLRQ